MANLITLVRTMINDPSASQFTDQQVQDRLDASRDDIRYESLTIGPSIVNTASTSNQAQTIFADFYSKYQWWEDDIVLQGNNTATGAAWTVLTPVLSENIVGHWAFELNVFTAGTVPGQYPPVFATGKIYDVNRAAADLLGFWAATLATAYDFTADGQSFKRSQSMAAMLNLAKYYRGLAKIKSVQMNRRDVNPPLTSRRMRLLDDLDNVK